MLNIGVIGSGYAARARGLALRGEPGVKLLWLAGRDSIKTQELAQELGTKPCFDWQSALLNPELALVFICTANFLHAPMVRAALLAHKHVVVEYPLALDYDQAVGLYALAQQQQRLLHVEHIELLSGIHQTLVEHWPQLGEPTKVLYSTQTAVEVAPQRWTYQIEQFGFPMFGAVSRLQRLIALLGPIQSLRCQNQWSGLQDGYFTACSCQVQLSFCSGVSANLTYAKGTSIPQSENRLEAWGSQGQIHLRGQDLTVITPQGTKTLPTGSRQGLFQRDTLYVLDYLWRGSPLYISPAQVLYGLRVAQACAESSQTGQAVSLL